MKDTAGEQGGVAQPAKPRAGEATAGALRPGSGRWVESSWELCRGLSVHEGLPADAGLDEWIEALLRS